MKELRNTLFGAVFIISVCLLFYYPTFIHGKLPVPSDSLVGLYHPYRDFYASSYPRGVPFKNFLITDPVRQQIPWRKAVMDQWKNGSIPWWNPYSFAGAPLAANIQAGTFYPLNLVFLLFSFPTAWTVLIVLSTVLSGIFLFLFLRNCRLHLGASLVGSIAWSYSGFHIAWLTWGTIVHAALWLPLILLAVEKLRDGNKGKTWFVILVAALTLNVFAGHAQVSLYVFAVALAFALFRYQTIQLRRLVLALFVSLTLSAVQWVPYGEAALLSARVNSPNLWMTKGWFLPWQHLVQFIAPDFFGNPSTLNYWGEWNYGEFVGYIGFVPLLFAVSRMIAPVGDAAFWTVVALVGFVFMLPTLLGQLPYRMGVPLFSSLQPTRIMIIVSFALSVLSAYGLNEWIGGRTKKLRISLIFFGGILVFLWVWVLIGLRTAADATSVLNLSVAKRNLYLPSLLLVASAVIFGSIGLLHRLRSAKRLLVVGFLFVTVFDLLRFGWKFTPFSPREYFFPETETLSFLRNIPKPFRIMTLDDRILPPNVSAYYGIESIDGYDPLYLARYGTFITLVESGQPTLPALDFRRILTPRNVHSPLLPLLNVRYVLTLSDMDEQQFRKVHEEGETRVYEYTDFLPRAYLVGSARVSQNDGETVNLLFRDDVLNGSSVIVEKPVNIAQIPIHSAEYAEIRTYSPSHLTIMVHATDHRILVILNQFYPGWRATIDGAESEVLRVNYLFQGIRIPPGTHTIELTFRRI